MYHFVPIIIEMNWLIEIMISLQSTQLEKLFANILLRIFPKIYNVVPQRIMFVMLELSRPIISCFCIFGSLYFGPASSVTDNN